MRTSSSLYLYYIYNICNEVKIIFMTRESYGQCQKHRPSRTCLHPASTISDSPARFGSCRERQWCLQSPTEAREYYLKAARTASETSSMRLKHLCLGLQWVRVVYLYGATRNM